jgi:hypothetical protein
MDGRMVGAVIGAVPEGATVKPTDHVRVVPLLLLTPTVLLDGGVIAAPPS